MARFTLTLLIYLVFYNLSGQSVSNGLVAYYSFDKSAAKDESVVQDASSNSNHGSIIGNLQYTEDRFGRPCHALKFDGNSYVSVPDSKTLRKPKNSLSISVWFKISKGADFYSQWLTICCKGRESTESLSNPQYRMQATAQTVSINSEFTEIVVPQLKYETWYLYTYTFDGTVFRAYLNTDLFFEFDYHGNLNENKQPLEIGRDVPGSTEYFYGTMDDLKIYDRALTENEILMLFRGSYRLSLDDDCENPLVISSQKQDSIKPIHKKSVSISSTQTDDYENLPSKMDNEDVVYQNTVEVASRDVTFYAYDNEKEDGDIVSININGVWIKEKYKLKLRKPINPNPEVIRCTLTPGANNYLISKAWTVGTIPPNTMTIEIDDKKSIQKVTINSEIGLSGGIKIICKSG